MPSRTPADPATASARRRVLAVASLTFFAAGISLATIGPALPDLSRSTGADLAALGAVFTALYGGGLIAQLATGAIIDRVGHRPILVTGPAICAVGMAGVAVAPSLAVVLASSLLCGLGYGALIVGANLAVAAAYDDGGASALNLTNVFFGVGAIAGPAFVGVLLAAGLTAHPALGVAAGVLALTAVAALALRRRPPLAALVGGISPAPVRPPARLLISTPIAWAFGLLLLLYVGNEGSVGAWLGTYLGETAGTPRDAGAVATSGFWFALTAGRLLAGLFGSRLGAPRLLLVSLCGTLVAGIGFVVGMGSASVTIAAAILIGLSFGPIYPTTIALVAVRFSAGTGTVAGVVMTMGSLGGAVLPWLYGILILVVSPLTGIVLIPVSAVAMLGLWAAARHVGWRAPAAPHRAG
jgi:fucose permease